jgi:hypothetical protein
LERLEEKKKNRIKLKKDNRTAEQLKEKTKKYYYNNKEICNKKSKDYYYNNKEYFERKEKNIMSYTKKN